MAAIKTLERITNKWARVTAAAGAEYEEGVRNPGKNWLDETNKAVNAYKAGIQASLAANTFQKGVQRAGQSKWQTNALAKGPRRFAEGVGLATDAYSAGFRPYRDAINAITLPARGAKGDPANINRVAVIAKTLHDLKVSGAK